MEKKNNMMRRATIVAAVLGLFLAGVTTGVATATRANPGGAVSSRTFDTTTCTDAKPGASYKRYCTDGSGNMVRYVANDGTTWEKVAR
jgi:hypothetical protein